MGQHEVERRTREADRQQHRARQPGTQRRQPLPRERVEDGDDRRGLHQAERERCREAGAEQLEAQRQRIQTQRAVVVAHVAVQHRAVLDEVGRRQLRAGVDLRHPPLAPRQRRERREAHAQRRDHGRSRGPPWRAGSGSGAAGKAVAAGIPAAGAARGMAAGAVAGGTPTDDVAWGMAAGDASAEGAAAAVSGSSVVLTPSRDAG